MTLYGLPLWEGALVFARLGALLMLLPGFGEPAVSPRIRLALALAITVLLAPLLGPMLPPAPTSLGPAAALVIGELVIGLAIGLVARILVSSLALAGQIAGVETGLAFSTIIDPTMSQAGQVFSVFFALMGSVLVFATNVHHVFLAGFVGGYEVFPVGAPFAAGDWAALAVETAGRSFLLAVQISAPLMMAGLVFRMGLGVLARVAPQIQVFFVSLPLNLMGGFFVMALALSAGLYVWIEALDRFARTLG